MSIGDRRLFVFRHIASTILCASLAAVAFPQANVVEEGSRTGFLNPVAVPRFALVVGAQYYEQLDRVSNAYNDASEIANALAEAGGFSYIGFITDPLTDQEILDHVDYLAQLAGSSEQPAIVVFYFAGHGFQNGAWPYIVPVGASKKDPLDKSLSVEEIMRRLAVHHAGIAIFLLDSCRTGLMGSRSETGVASEIKPATLAALPVPRGAVLGLATEFGFPARSAAHSQETDSPYAKGLKRYIPQEALSLGKLLFNVKHFVEEKTDKDQSSFVVTNGNEDGFFFVPGNTVQQTEALRWQAVVKMNRTDCVEWFIDSHPGSLFLQAALQWERAASVGASTSGETGCPDEGLRY